MLDRQVIDTSVLIDFRRGVGDARRYISGLLRSNAAIVHPTVIGELLEGVRDSADLADTLLFVSQFKRLTVKSADFDRAIAVLTDVRLAHGVGWNDCLIAAACIRLRLPLVTLNDKHFRAIRGLRVVRPY